MRPGRTSGRRTVERIESGSDADQRVLDHLATLGCDLTLPREVHHFLYFSVREVADEVAQTLEAEGWSTAVEASEGAWLVIAKRVRTLTPELVHETRTQLASLASELGGVYDGWEVPLTQ